MDDALKYEEASIQNEERFDNLLTKSRILDGMGKKDEAAATRNQAIGMANALQLHGYGRQLQGQGQQAQAFEIFRTNIKRNPDHWVIHSEFARMACAKDEFEKALKEMKVETAGDSPQFKA